MTVLLVAKYGNFNQSVLLTNLAYDIALTLRTAQTYGLSVQGQTGEFGYAYGVDFCALTENCPKPSNDNILVDNQHITMFADVDGLGGYKDNVSGGDDFYVSSYSIKRGARIVGFCAVNNCPNPDPNLDTSIKRVVITFKRPYPDAIICVSADASANSSSCAKLTGMATKPKSYVKIFIEASDGSRRTIVVRESGEIAVGD